MLRPLKKNLKGVLKMFEKILFDLDGTLLDSLSVWDKIDFEFLSISYIKKCFFASLSY